MFFAGVPTAPATATSHEETAVNSDNVRQGDVQEEPVVELAKDDSLPTPSDHQSDTSSNMVEMTASEPTFSEIQQEEQVKGDSLPTASDHRSDTSSNMVDMTASEPTFSEIQQESEPSEPTIDKDNIRTELAIDMDRKDGYGKAQTGEDSEDNSNNVVAEPATDNVVESDGNKTPTADQVEQDTSTTEPDGVGGSADDGKVEAEDSGGDDGSEEQFLSPAASEADIVGSFTPTKEQPGNANILICMRTF